jgi:hypothetical protein
MARARVRYSDRVATKILRQLSNGKTLHKICDAEGMPDRGTVYDWLRADPNFARLFQIAQTDFGHSLFSEAIDIADEDVTDAAQARRQATRVQTRQYAAAKLLPKIYGQRVELNVGDHHVPGDDEPVDLTELARGVAFMLTRAYHQKQAPTQKQILALPMATEVVNGANGD